MNIKHVDLEINKDEPFANCKLERKKYADILTSIVDAYPEGFVLALNNEWGTGKTTFVKMWNQSLKNAGYSTVYFNAWENDFNSNPLIAIVSELKTLTNSSNEKIFKSVLQKGAVLSKNILPALIKAIAEKYIDTGILTDTIENITKGTTEILEDEVKKYADKKESVKEFRFELELFVKKTSNSKLIVFIIDELDRCRPNYAVEVLEQMKHFFSVPGIVFVLSIDKIQLGHAVKGVYGNDNINSNEYLRRFIDLEYSLPTPSDKVFCNYLYDYYSFDKFFDTKERNQHRELNGDKSDFLKMATAIFSKDNNTLRQQEKLFAQTRLVISSFQSNSFIFPELLFLLIYIKMMFPELYSKIEKKGLSLQELSDEFFEIVSNQIQIKYNLNLLYIEAQLLDFYNNQHDYSSREKILDTDEKGKPISPIKSKLEISDGATLASCIEHISRSFHYRDLSLKYLLDRINMTEAFVSL